MIKVIEQETFSLKEETKDIIVSTNVENNLVKIINSGCNNIIETLGDDPLTTINTLKQLRTKRVHFVNYEHLNNDKKRKKVYEKIANLKGDFVVLIDTFEIKNGNMFIDQLIEIIYTNNYKLQTYKTKQEKINKIYHIFTTKDVQDSIKKGIVLGETINRCKTLVNTPYSHMKANDLATHAKELETYDNVIVKIYGKSQIEGMNMGSYLGVNKGSKDEPKLIKIEYKNTKKETPITALVGKGVMYDTGGYSLKTPQYMPGMKVDMAGAAAVISAIEAIARLQLDAHVFAIVAATDNRIGDDAIVPDDILTSASGQTIEVISTDAEGRLTLADAVWFAQKEGAKRIVDVATLTGSIVRALGKAYTGAYTNSDEFFQEFKTASNKTNEPIWKMPITDMYRDELKSDIADMTNKGGSLAGASIAAAFIEKFIDDDTSWIHLDIAGTASDKKTGATGVMVKTFTELFM